MSYNCSSANFSSNSLGVYQCYLGSSFPSNLVYSTDFCSPSSCQLDSSLYSQEICCEPIRTQTSHVASTFFSPCWTTHPGSLGFRSSKDCSLNPGSKGCYLLGCGSSGFRPLGYGVWGSPTLGYGSRSYHSTYLDFWPICGSSF
ncbi:hypothetical protein AB1E18_000047 [Capra hircus]